MPVSQKSDGLSGLLSANTQESLFVPARIPYHSSPNFEARFEPQIALVVVALSVSEP